MIEVKIKNRLSKLYKTMYWLSKKTRITPNAIGRLVIIIPNQLFLILYIKFISL